MLGGGTFTLQNKTLPGAYINFVSAANASAELSDRGIVTMPLTLDWGPDGMFEVTQEEFIDNPIPKFGYAYSDPKLKPLRDLFKHASKLYAYRLNQGGAKANSIYATAKYAGTRGNAITIVIESNTDKTFDVITMVGTYVVDRQNVATAADLKDNDYVDFLKDATLEATAGTPLTGGTDGVSDGDSYQKYRDAADGYAVNIMAVPTTDKDTIRAFEAYVRRMRENAGKKMQLVVYGAEDPDYEGVIDVANTVHDKEAPASILVYWVGGAEAGCAISKTVTNMLYDGEYDVDVSYTQSGLEDAIKSGKFAFHSVNGKVRVLRDINSLVSTSKDKNELFKDNKVIRILDQIGNDIAVMFEENYLGQIPNDADGRITFWNDLVDYHNQLSKLRAIQNFDSKDIAVSQGKEKNAVLVDDGVEVTGTMEKLYMTVKVA